MCVRVRHSHRTLMYGSLHDMYRLRFIWISRGATAPKAQVLNQGVTVAHVVPKVCKIGKM